MAEMVSGLLGIVLRLPASIPCPGGWTNVPLDWLGLGSRWFVEVDANLRFGPLLIGHL